jgi:Uma2 family endonuclease
MDENRGMSAAVDIEGPQVWKIDRVRYHQLGQSGAFNGRRVQLVEGVVIEMSPMGIDHANVVSLLTRHLVRSVDDRLLVRVQVPLAVGDDSEPEPGFAIVPFEKRAAEHPSTALLVIEVADSSRAFDLGPKAALYARAKVPEYWVIDLARAQLVVHRKPKAGRYTSVRTVGRAHALTSTSVPAVKLTLSELD